MNQRLDDVSYKIAEWVVLRQQYITRKITLRLWLEVNNEEVSEQEFEWLYANWHKHIVREL